MAGPSPGGGQGLAARDASRPTSEPLSSRATEKRSSVAYGIDGTRSLQASTRRPARTSSVVGRERSLPTCHAGGRAGLAGRSHPRGRAATVPHRQGAPRHPLPWPRPRRRTHVRRPAAPPPGPPRAPWPARRGEGRALLALLHHRRPRAAPAPELARFARPLPRQIGKLLLQNPLGRTELRRRLGCADSTLGYHLNRLVAAGDLQRRPGRNGGQYCLADSEGVRRALLMLQEGEREPSAGAPSTPASPATAQAPAPLVVAPNAPAPAPTPGPRTSVPFTATL